MDRISLTYYGHVFDASGYGQAARGYIHALHAAGVRLSVVDLMNHGRQVRDDLVESLIGRPLDSDFRLFHGIPPQWASLAFRFPNAIGMTVWETDTMPTQWRNVLGHVVDLWLPCAFNVETFRRALQTPIFKLPHPVVPRRVNGHVVDADRLIGANASDFVFYAIFEWQDRKGPIETLRAYFDAFREDADALLVLKVNPNAKEVATRAVNETRRRTGSLARVALRAEVWGEPEIEALHARGNCYVSLHRGEGWGYPLFDAVTRGKPVVATAFAGPLDYLPPDASRLVPFTLVPVRQPYTYYGPQMRWAEPDVAEASRALREVHADRLALPARAASAAAKACEAYSLERVGTTAAARLMELLHDRNRQRWRAIQLKVRPDALDPTPPIDGDWYDEDYFELGVKSNWIGGYGWNAFASLFRETAAYVTEMFPEAASFLDAGCAKGFLVRCLREAGRESWGVDHSGWAIDHADRATQPFLTRAAVDEMTFDRQIDVLLAFDLLSHLTESQAERFLTRARPWTRGALLATIASFDDDGDRARHAASDDRDRSHVTMRLRSWWHELFLKTGWRLDPLQRLGAERCRTHPLPRRMGWKVYAYSPR
jgi:2-polyprenyl-3-methyl-5-hydroxy-6-metoxy-1,4-benzoquinol methylase